MNGSDVAALSPYLALAAGGVVLLLGIALRRSHTLSATLSLVTIAAAACLLPVAAAVAPRSVTPLLRVDGFALFYTGLLLAAGAATTLIAFGYLRGREEPCEEYYLLLLLALVGAAVLTAANHAASLFLGLETLSIGLYGLIGYFRERRVGVEAAIKYLVLAGATSAFLLFGLALLYAATGSLTFGGMTAWGTTEPARLLVFAAVALITVGLGFKLALVPFHLWTPDVYQGAPAPTTAFLATASKAAVAAVLLRWLTTMGAGALPALLPILGIAAALSMVGGNLLALLERNVKRLLAYSSIAHLGYVITAVLAGRNAIEVVGFYLAAYVVTTLGAFGVVSVLSPPEGDAEGMEHFRGLFWTRPGLAFLLAACLLSLAGIPVTAGFLGKLYVLSAGIGAGRWILVWSLIVGSAVGIFYYIRLIVVMASPVDREFAEGTSPRAVPLTAAFALTALAVAVVGIGIYPEPLLRLIRSASQLLG